jgi:DNA-binding Lrp family transcriptional regulator
MDSKDVKTLFLLEAIGKEGCQSQRELSKKVRMSLGQVNALIKQLKIRKIYRTINLSGNKVRYTLTSKGAKEKASLIRQYLSFSISYYNEVKQLVSELLTALKKNGNRNLIFYGAGELCEITCIVSNEQKVGKIKVIDDKKAGETICGLKIYEEAKMNSFNFDAVVIMDFENISTIRKKLIDRCVPSYKIYSVIL